MLCPFCKQELPEERDVFDTTESNALSDEAIPAPTKRRKTPIIVGVLAAAAVIAVAVIALNFNSLIGSAVKTFMSPKAYLAYVEARQTASYAKVLEDIKDLSAAPQAPLCVEQDVRFRIGPALSALLAASPDADLSFLNGLGIALDTTIQEDLTAITLAVESSQMPLLTSEILLDSAADDQYITIRELTDRYLLIGENDTELSTFNRLTPNEEQLRTLLKDCLTIAFEQAPDVIRTEETIVVGNTQQECTVLSMPISEAVCWDIVYAILTDLKTNETVKELIEAAATRGEDSYAAYITAIDTLLNDVSAVKANADDSERLTLFDYVDEHHNIIGRKLTADGETVFSYISAVNGRETTSVVTIAALTLEGSSTDTNGVISGSYALSVGGVSYAAVAVSDLTVKDDLNGTIRLTPSKELFSAVIGDDATATMLSMTAPSLALQFTEQEKRFAADLDLLAKQTLLFGMSYTAALGDTDEATLTLPSADKIVDSSDALAVDEWIAGWDIDGLTANLKSNGLPQTVIDIVEAVLAEHQQKALYGI